MVGGSGYQQYTHLVLEICRSNPIASEHIEGLVLEHDGASNIPTVGDCEYGMSASPLCGSDATEGSYSCKEHLNSLEIDQTSSSWYENYLKS